MPRTSMARLLLLSVLPVSLGAATPTPLVPLQSDDKCSRCTGYLMPGKIVQSPETVWRIDSDLPEIFLSRGVLYATVPTLPPFLTKEGVPVSPAMRQQRNAGFKAIDGSFEVFLYHMSNPGEEPRSRRVVVYARNVGSEPVTITPRQIMEVIGEEPTRKMAKIDGPEGRLGVRQLGEKWDQVVQTVVIPAGQGAAIGWSPRLSKSGDVDATTSDFFTGTVRADVAMKAAGKPALEVYVVGVGSDVPVEGLGAACEALLETGAHSGEGSMDLNIPPPECHVRRVVGVSRNFLWESDNVVIDAAGLDASGVAFQMAAPKVQTVGCEQARQTQDLVLHPPYVHPDTVGNYMQEYMVTLTLSNPGTTPRTVDVRFGKQDADIGLAWQVAVADTPTPRDAMKALPIVTEWAGGWRTDDRPDNTRSFFVKAPGTIEAAPLVLEGGATKTVTLRFFPLASSSLPFQIVVANAGGPQPWRGVE